MTLWGCCCSNQLPSKCKARHVINSFTSVGELLTLFDVKINTLQRFLERRALRRINDFFCRLCASTRVLWWWGEKVKVHPMQAAHRPDLVSAEQLTQFVQSHCATKAKGNEVWRVRPKRHRKPDLSKKRLHQLNTLMNPLSAIAMENLLWCLWDLVAFSGTNRLTFWGQIAWPSELDQCRNCTRLWLSTPCSPSPSYSECFCV